MGKDECPVMAGTYRTLRRTLATSNGVVTAAAVAPATPPAMTCVDGEYSPVGLRKLFMASYTENCTAESGMLIVSVVGYEM